MEPAIGYRAWRMSESRLLSLVTPLVWEPQQVQKARCLSDTIVAPYLRDPWRSLLPQHPSPSSSCSCGFYAAYRLADVMKSRFGRNARCLGAIAAWGRVVLHREGFRAESVQLLGLLLPAKDASSGDIANTVPTVGRAYGVPVFLKAEDLEAYATEFGTNYSPEPPKPPSRLSRLLRHLTD
ncbi:MAG TPA: hypothetical protein VIT43_14530 [Candidatus Dormibacteraeota bacterium]